MRGAHDRPRAPQPQSGPGPGRTSSTAPTASPESGRSAVEARIRAALWKTIPPALATELGALAVIGFGALPGIAVGIVGVIVLHLAFRRLVAGATAVRAALLISGPPLRYGLLSVAIWYEWVIRRSGPGPALAAGLLLAVVVPMIGSVLAAPRDGSVRR